MNDLTAGVQPATIYRPHARYVLMAGVSAICALLLGWFSLATLDFAALFFLAVAVLLLLAALRSLGSHVALDAQGLTLVRPLAKPLRIQFRQLAEVTEEGRLQRVILLLYYPLRADGLVDLDALAGQSLPALEEQAELLELLEAKTLH